MGKGNSCKKCTGSTRRPINHLPDIKRMVPMHESAVKAMMIMIMGMLGLWAIGTAAPIRAATDMHRAAILPERPHNLEGQSKRKATRRRRV